MENFLHGILFLAHFALYFGWYKLGKFRGYQDGLKFSDKVLNQECQKSFLNHKDFIKKAAVEELITEGTIKATDVSWQQCYKDS